MANCIRCKKTGFGFFEIKDGLCPSCQREEKRAEEAAAPVIQTNEDERKATRGVTLSTEAMAPEGADRLGIVCAEAPFGLHIGKDFLTGFRDIFGGRAKALEKTLAAAREEALADLRVAAHRLGADGVVAVHVAYGTIGTGGSMGTQIVLVTAHGTAIRTRKD